MLFLANTAPELAPVEMMDKVRVDKLRFAPFLSCLFTLLFNFSTSYFFFFFKIVFICFGFAMLRTVPGVSLTPREPSATDVPILLSL